MAKTILGVDVGYDSFKLALCRDGAIKKAVSIPMPKNLMREGRVVSTETMGELIRSAMKENGIHATGAAFVLPNESVFVRTVTMPRMTAEQLLYNIPFEFNDYITDELKNYVFDYAMLSSAAETESGAPGMDLMAVAAPVSLIDDVRELLRRAGLRLVRTAPAISAYISLIRAYEARTGQVGGEYCVLDLGYQSIRMYMFKGDRHMVTRELEIGLSSLDQVIADAFNVDIHLAHTYLLTDYNECTTGEACMAAYNNIAVELMRALNFYRFSNPDSNLNDIWIAGGGAVITPLRTAIEVTLDMRIHAAEELLPDTGGIPDAYGFVQAAGITLD